MHCAGVLPPERTVTAQGHEVTFATHVLGPFLLTAGLRPLLQADGDGRVIWVSSGGMYTAPLPADDLEYEAGEYKGSTAYARTKRMQVVLAEQLAAAFIQPGDPVVHSMHPGMGGDPGCHRLAADVRKVHPADPAVPGAGRRHHRLARRRRRPGAVHRAVLARPAGAADALPPVAEGRPRRASPAVELLPERDRCSTELTRAVTDPGGRRCRPRSQNHERQAVQLPGVSKALTVVLSRSVSAAVHSAGAHSAASASAYSGR